MSKLALVIRELHRAETRLGRNLLAVADRHHVEHEIFHVARDIARWPQDHVERLARIGHDHGVTLDPTPRWSPPGRPSASPRVRRRGGSRTGSRRSRG